MGREFGAAGKRAEVVVQRHPTDLDDLLGVGELVLDLVLVERHLNGVVLGPLDDDFGPFASRAKLLSQFDIVCSHVLCFHHL